LVHDPRRSRRLTGYDMNPSAIVDRFGHRILAGALLRLYDGLRRPFNGVFANRPATSQFVFAKITKELAMTTMKFALCGSLLITAGLSSIAGAQENPAEMALGGGKLRLKAPANWVRKQPQTSIVEHEFAIPASKGDTADGRLTVMAAGGGVEANIDRWYGQFTQPDGGSTRERAKVKKAKLAGEEVHLVDVSGTFKDQRGPAAPAVERPKYRMLAAIIATKSAGNYFIKFYGPERTVADNEKAFQAMIDGLEQK
jgi:hypothetical protein